MVNRVVFLAALGLTAGACGSNDDGGGAGGSSGFGAAAGTAGMSGFGGSSATGGTSTGGSGGTSGGSGGSAGATACNGITGTYAMIRTRDGSSPGSCPPNYQYNPSMPGKVTVDATKPSGFDVQIGYSDTAGEIIYSSCTNNVVGCKIFATCVPDAGTDQVTLDITGNSITGTLSRTSSGGNDCSVGGTINFVVSGTRQ